MSDWRHYVPLHYHSTQRPPTRIHRILSRIARKRYVWEDEAKEICDRWVAKHGGWHPWTFIQRMHTWNQMWAYADVWGDYTPLNADMEPFARVLCRTCGGLMRTGAIDPERYPEWKNLAEFPRGHTAQWHLWKELSEFNIERLGRHTPHCDAVRAYWRYADTSYRGVPRKRNYRAVAALERAGQHAEAAALRISCYLDYRARQITADES